MKKLWIPLFGFGGALVAIQAILWEFTRMTPDYGFIVDPWSLRGTDIVHGQVFAAIGAVAFAAFGMVFWKGSQAKAASAGVVAVIIALGTGVAAFFGTEPYVFTPGFPVISLGTIVLGLAIYRLIKGGVGTAFSSFTVRIIATLVVFAIVATILNTLIGGKEQSLDAWVIVLAILGSLAVLSVSTAPREIAANRMLIFSSVIGALAMAGSAGAIRSTLIRFQEEGDSTAARYLDSQVTSGYLLGVIGMVMVTIGAVMLWARRRDLIASAERAARQRAAAEASAAEIEEAQRQIAVLS